MESTNSKRIYLQIKEAIRSEALLYPSGVQFGTEAAFVKKYNVSRPTVRKAVNDLIDEGLILRIPGKGLKISSKKSAGNEKGKLLVMIVQLIDDDGIFSKAILGIIEKANGHDYGYTLFSCDSQKQVNLLENLDLSQYSGAILVAFDTEADWKSLEILEKQHLPYVLIDNPLEGGTFRYVVGDDYKGGLLIGEHLISLGHRRILYMGYNWPAVTTKLRYKGLQDAMNSAGARLSPEDTVHLLTFDEIYNYIKGRIEGGTWDYTAIATSDDLLAMYTINALEQLGFSVPKDISVTGYGDNRLAAFLKPPLTTIHVPGYKIGQEAVELLLQPNLSGRIARKVVDVDLVVRNSTASRIVPME